MVVKNLRQIIEKLPKADLHNHLTLGPSVRSLKKQYPGIGLIVPRRYDGLEGMIKYIHENINPGMATKEDVVKYMEIAIEDCIADTVVLLEASIDINLIRYFNGSIEQLIEAVGALRIKYRDGIDFKPEIGLNKDAPLDEAHRCSQKCIDSGEYFGIDLYGPERDMKLAGFVDIFDSAKKKGLKTKIHIGEFSDAASIEEAISLLHPDEIQHGIKAADSEKTMAQLKAKNIRLNICPQSNISLGAEESIKQHPIRALYDHGVRISINTDDRILFDASITDQYMDLINNDVFSFDEINSIRENSLQ
jgi:adenosine deaminase